MERPKAYGAFHLTFFFVGLAVCILAAWLLRKSNERQNRAVLLTVGGLLLVSEVYKQLFYTFVIGGGSYQWWIFPFQLCSVPMYLCLLAGVVKNDKVRQYMYNFMLSYNLLGGFIAFFEPSGLTHEYWTLTLHAFIWHMLLVFVGVYLGLSGRAGVALPDFKKAAVIYCILCVIAFGINLALAKVSENTINMFYVGPRYSPLIVFKSISEKFGWYVNTPIYMAATSLGAFVFHWLFTVINRKLGSKAEDAAA